MIFFQLRRHFPPTYAFENLKYVSARQVHIIFISALFTKVHGLIIYVLFFLGYPAPGGYPQTGFAQPGYAGGAVPPPAYGAGSPGSAMPSQYGAYNNDDVGGGMGAYAFSDKTIRLGFIR